MEINEMNVFRKEKKKVTEYYTYFDLLKVNKKLSGI